LHQDLGSEVYILEIPVKSMDFRAAGEGASRIKDALKKIGFAPEVVRRAAIAAYEAEMNIVIHSYGGVLQARFYPEKVELQAKDKGPGIPDIALAMREGYSTAPQQVREMGFGAGMGLPNIKRCVDELAIETEVGQGTLVRMVIFNRTEKMC
jgi:anti-sigma regulatory factor (Ser/Thr protein kinase)